MQLSIVIPAYNEEKIIAEAIQKIADYFNNLKYDYELIIVDDCSSDRTKKQIEKKLSSKIFLIENQKNLGKGASLKKGILQAKNDWVLVTDADLSTPIKEFDKFIDFFDSGIDIAIGSRKTQKNLIKKAQPWWKQILGMSGNKIIKIILGLAYNDTQCGFKLFGPKVKPLIKKQKISRWGFDFELLFLARQLDLRVKEVGVVWYNNHNSKVKFRDYFKTLIDVFRVRWNYFSNQYK